MTAEVRKLFQTNVELLDIVDKAIIYFREQDYPAALELIMFTVLSLQQVQAREA